jgi:ABC-type nitrate/sulfonate/bicarbonate transport system substrate-binding protein
MPIALSILLPFAELAGIAIGTVSTAIGVTALSNKVEDYIEDNPEQAEKIFAMIMPEQGLAALFNKEADSGDENISDEEAEVEEKPKLSGREKGNEQLKKQFVERVGKKDFQQEEIIQVPMQKDPL